MIELVGGYAMDTYEFGYRVGKPYKRKKGGIDLGRVTYHRTPASAIENALERVIRDRVEDESITTLSELLAEMQKQRQELEALIAPLGYVGRPREPSESDETDDLV